MQHENDYIWLHIDTLSHPINLNLNTENKSLMSSWQLTVIPLSMYHWSRLHYNWLLTQHKLIFINQQHMRVSFSNECSTFLVDVAHLKRYIDISGIHWIPVGKVFYPYPTRCISGIWPSRTHGWVFLPISISIGYETRGYPYPHVQLSSLDATRIRRGEAMKPWSARRPPINGNARGSKGPRTEGQQRSQASPSSHSSVNARPTNPNNPHPERK
jgi:hypothetical protein